MISRLNRPNATFGGIIPINPGKCIVTKNGIPAWGVERFNDDPNCKKFHLHPAGLSDKFNLTHHAGPKDTIEDVAKQLENKSWEE